VCELFEQYERKGRNEGLLQGRSEGLRQGRSEGISQGRSEGLSQGIKVLIQTCREIRLSFTETAEKVKNGFQLDDAELEKNMQLYWPE
ncbi:MAG: hypothetical protein NC543_05265, partial [bacterium]|nr:hypothetical protein [bacterium]MCM1374378.1 hypothetical protein [Muribaculum sp.]